MGGPTASTFSESEKWTNAASLFDESTVALELALPCVKKKALLLVSELTAYGPSMVCFQLTFVVLS